MLRHRSAFASVLVLDLCPGGGHDLVVTSDRLGSGRGVPGWGAILLVSLMGLGCGDSSPSGGDLDAATGGARDAAAADASAAPGDGGCLPSDASYTACGCGCCPGEPAVPVCLGPGETLESVEEADRAAAMSPGCPMTGCSIPQEYSCCR